MPVPKRKRSRARRDKRFANKGLEETAFTKCAECNTPLLPHQACRECGFYKGSKLFQAKADRSERRKAKKPTAKQSKQPVESEQE